MTEAVRLVHPNGCAVTVDRAKVDALLARGFKRPAPAVRRQRKKSDQ